MNVLESCKSVLFVDCSYILLIKQTDLYVAIAMYIFSNVRD